MPTYAKLYYECHITLEPLFGDEEKLDILNNLCESYKFRIADLFLQKRKNDSEIRSKYDTFITGHSKELDELEDRMSDLIKELKFYAIKVWRYKIEEAITDSKIKDEFNLLGII